LPARIGLVIRFGEHEWYQNLLKAMKDYGQQYGIELELVDIEQTVREEVELCRSEIARCAAEQVRPGDVILIDGGPISAYLADQLVDHQNITVISNSMPVLEKLKGHPEITLIAIGGALRHTSQVFVGPTAENSVRGFRVDKLFLMVTGISPSFGLSHTNISEVTIKQIMIRSAREVILLADHTCFGRESTIQVAPLTSAHKLITDDALPASSRLELTKQGLQIIVAGMS
jgi:DeoR family fructose operon transcriptional repressor